MPVMVNWFSNLLRFFLLAPVIIADPRCALDAMHGYWWIALEVGLLLPMIWLVTKERPPLLAWIGALLVVAGTGIMLT